MNALTIIKPSRLAEEPAGPKQVDPLSDAFRTVRMTSAAFFRVIADGPSVADQLPSSAALSTILGGAEHTIIYYVVTEGSCFATLAGSASIELHAGQIVMFPGGESHQISSEPVLADPSLERRFAPSEMRLGAEIAGETRPNAKLVCGLFACDSGPFDLLLKHLPPMLIGESTEEPGLPSAPELIQIAMGESETVQVSRQTVLGRLAELMLIQVVRQHVRRMPAGSATWLSALRDDYVGRAIALMHGDPRRNWSINRLAREVGLSRSRFAERFTSLVGIPPKQYLAKWRMERAARLLCCSVNIASIANEVGYSSEASFSRAFKKIIGVPPSRWRRQEELMAA